MINKKNGIKKIVLVFMVTALLSLSTVACSNKNDKISKQTENNNIKIACLAPSAPMIEWIKEKLDPQGYNVEVVTFNENQLPATALKEGDIDGFITNQIVWLQSFNKKNSTNLQMLKPYIYYPGYAAYSSKHKTIDAIPEKAQVAIPGDPSNMERCLLILRDMKLITLGEKSGEFYSLIDIDKNFKNIKILETEITATARSMKDADLIICTSTSVRDAGFDPLNYLYEDPRAKDFSISLVVQPKDVESKWAKAVMEITQGDYFRQNFNEFFKGTRVLYKK